MDSKKNPFCTSAAFASYEVVFTAGVVAFAPYAVAKMLNTPAYRAGLLERLSLKTPANTEAAAPSPIWIQAVSLGEVKSVAPLVHAILQKKRPVHLTTTTETGHRVARELFSDAQIAYFPLDFKWAAARVLSRIRPRAIVLFETEIWPNFIRAAASLGIPIVIVNGRISEASYRCYRLLSPIFRRTFASISRLGMQSAADAQRAVALGADAARVHLCGNMKFDAVAEPPSAERVEQIRRAILLPAGAPLIVGGSTHEGEELALLHALRRVHSGGMHEVRLLLAPRHPERFDAVDSLIRQQGFQVLRRSRGSDADSSSPQTIILLDSVGELAQVYSLASISFVGGSLAKIGGHNIIEPASAGKPVLFGPHMHHFKDIRDAFLTARAARCVATEEELYRQVQALLADPADARALGDAALRVVKSNKGATGRCLDLLEDFL